MPYIGFEEVFYSQFEKLKRQIEMSPIVLGGVTASGGGQDGRPGTFIGKLPQTFVTYDLSELGTASTSGSPSLLDNLNHIRYKLLDAVESGVIASGIAMNNYPLFDVDYIDFNLINGIDPAEGRLVWNDDDGTLNLGMPGGNVNLQIGQEMLVRALNDEAFQITNGKIVRVSGGTGNFAKIKLSDNSSIVTAGSLGIATEDIPSGQKGYVTNFGFVRDVDTSGMAAGSLLWLDNNGDYTTTVPTPPDIKVIVGIVVREHATEGIIHATIVSVPRLKGLSDVVINSIADNDLIAWDTASGVFTNQNSTELGFDSKYVEVAGDTMTGGLIIDDIADEVLLTLTPDAGQTDNIFEITDSGGTARLLVDSGQNLRVTRNVGFGATGTVNSRRIINAIRQYTSNSGVDYGAYISSTGRPLSNGTGTTTGLLSTALTHVNAFNHSNLRGVHSVTTHASSANLTSLVGLYNVVSNTGGGAITTAYGLWSRILNTTGTITTVYGHYIDITEGTLTNAYGLYIANVSGAVTNNYAIYTNAGNIAFNSGGAANTVVIGESSIQTNAGFLQIGSGWTFKEDAGDPTADTGYAKIWTKSDNILYWQDGDGTTKNVVDSDDTMDSFIALTSYDAEPSRTNVSNIHGGLLSLAVGQPLDSVPTDLVVTKGIGKLMIVINAGGDVSGSITVTGTSVDRNTGATTPADTDTITVDALTTDNSDTDSNGNIRHAFTGAYITSKWFHGTVTLSTADLTLTDVDVYHVSFEQFNDQSNLTLTTFDVNLITTNVSAEFDAYLYSLEVIGDKCDIERTASLNVGADGLTALANKYERLRRGNLAKALDGTTAGIWVDIYYSNSPAYVEDVTIKIWATKTQTITIV